MSDWDTWGLFQTLLDGFTHHLQDAQALHSDNIEDTVEVRAAIIGFLQFRPMEEWDWQHLRFIQERLDGDLSELTWFEEGAEAIRLFSCLCLGAMLGKYASAQIDDAGFLLGDAHLAGFNATEDEKICAAWQSYKQM